MAVLEILKYPHPILKKRCRDVTQIDEKVKRLVEDMIETMYSAKGIGLAACQVGVPERVIVLDVRSSERPLRLGQSPDCSGGRGGGP